MCNGKYEIHWISWHPTPYNDFLFRSLSEDPEVELTVHFKREILSSHPWQSQIPDGFKSRTYRLFMGIDWRFLVEVAKNKRTVFVIAGWDDLNTLIIINLLAALGRPLILWTDTPDMRRRSFIKGTLRGNWLKWVFRRATRIMATGQPGVDALLQMGCPRSKAVNFPFFIDLDFYRRTNGHSMGDASRKIRFVSAGRLLNSIKGHDVAISAFGKARKTTGLDNFIYYLAGTGPDMDVLEKQVKALDLENNVKFLGWVESAKLREYFRTCDVLVHPSLNDPFPNAVLEAMASSMAVLGSDVCGSVRDRIRHGENGLIHRSGDVEELASHISQVLTNPGLVKQMGAAARRMAETWPVSRATQILKSIIEDCSL